jgi:lipopolysaccharide transport system ATP-binding protein
MTPPTKNNQPVITLRNVAVNFWRKKGMFHREPFAALKDVSFDLYHGDSLGVIGRNGAGKSTLLRLLGGITKPDKGTLINNGYQTSLLSLQVGFDPLLSGRDNAILSGMFLGFRKKEVEARLGEIVAFSELENFIDQPVRTYSSGMKARLGFSVAIYLDPDILLIDEVLAVGDAEFKKKSHKVMQEKIKSDKTIVLVSHNAPTIRQLCNRAVWIEEGVTRAEGDTAMVLNEYEKFLNGGGSPK